MNTKQYSSILTMILIGAFLGAIVSVKILAAHADPTPEPLQTQQPVAAAERVDAKWEYRVLIDHIEPYNLATSREALQGAINRLAEQGFQVESFQPISYLRGEPDSPIRSFTYITVLMKRPRK
jgi:hypothetical protein